MAESKASSKSDPGKKPKRPAVKRTRAKPTAKTTERAKKAKATKTTKSAKATKTAKVTKAAKATKTARVKKAAKTSKVAPRTKATKATKATKTTKKAAVGTKAKASAKPASKLKTAPKPKAKKATKPRKKTKKAKSAPAPKPVTATGPATDARLLYEDIAKAGGRRAAKDAVLVTVWLLGGSQHDVTFKDVAHEVHAVDLFRDVRVKPHLLKHCSRSRMLEHGPERETVRLTKKGIRYIVGLMS